MSPPLFCPDCVQTCGSIMNLPLCLPFCLCQNTGCSSWGTVAFTICPSDTIKPRELPPHVRGGWRWRPLLALPLTPGVITSAQQVDHVLVPAEADGDHRLCFFIRFQQRSKVKSTFLQRFCRIQMFINR